MVVDTDLCVGLAGVLWGDDLGWWLIGILLWRLEIRLLLLL